MRTADSDVVEAALCSDVKVLRVYVVLDVIVLVENTVALVGNREDE